MKLVTKIWEYGLVVALVGVACLLASFAFASVDTLPKGGDAKQAPCASKGSAVPKADAQ